MRYSLVFHAPEPQAGGPHPSPEVMEEMQKLMADYADALYSAGIFIAAEMLEPQSATTTVTRRGGSVVIEDGPFAASKEALAGSSSSTSRAATRPWPGRRSSPARTTGSSRSGRRRSRISMGPGSSPERRVPARDCGDTERHFVNEQTDQCDPIDRAMVLSQDGWGRIIALIASADGDLAGAEDALGSALERAVSVWRKQGVPANPEGWLYSVALNVRKDVWKSAAARTSAVWDPEVHEGSGSAGPSDPEASPDPDALPDRRLELLAACAHPDIDPAVRPLLMLSAVMGMTGKQIAAGMALPAATVAGRLTRAKKRIAVLGIGFGLPDCTELEARLADIHEAIYGAFAIDWVHAAAQPRDGTIGETLYLSRLLTELCPADGETHGLAALVHLSAARFPARRSEDGRFVPLSDQDPRKWDATLIARGEHHLRAVHSSSQIGRFGLQAAIQVLHMSGVRSGTTDWPMLRRLHDDLARIAPNPGGSISRAAVIAEIEAPTQGYPNSMPWTQRSPGPARALEARLAYRRAIEATTDPAERADPAYESESIYPNAIPIVKKTRAPMLVRLRTWFQRFQRASNATRASPRCVSVSTAALSRPLLRRTLALAVMRKVSTEHTAAITSHITGPEPPLHSRSTTAVTADKGARQKASRNTRLRIAVLIALNDRT